LVSLLRLALIVRRACSLEAHDSVTLPVWPDHNAQRTITRGNDRIG
jgi:hypothetical protein